MRSYNVILQCTVTAEWTSTVYTEQPRTKVMRTVVDTTGLSRWITIY